MIYAGTPDRRSCTKRTTIAPSPTAVAQRLIEPDAHVAGGEDARDARLEQARRAPASSPVRMKPSSSRATTSPSQSVHGAAPRKRKRNENGSRSPSLSVTASSSPSVAVQLGDLAAVADGDAVAVELVDQVVGHRLAQVGAAVQQGDERAAAGEPDGGLPGGVAAADDADARGAAELRLGRPGGVEDAHALVVVEAVDRQAPVLGAGGEHDGARGDLVAVLEPHDVAVRCPARARARGTASRSGRRTCAPG